MSLVKKVEEMEEVSLKKLVLFYNPVSGHAAFKNKLDWIIDKLNSDWVDEKAVVYAKFRGAISALQGRLQKNGIGFKMSYPMKLYPILKL